MSKILQNSDSAASQADQSSLGGRMRKESRMSQLTEQLRELLPKSEEGGGKKTSNTTSLVQPKEIAISRPTVHDNEKDNPVHVEVGLYNVKKAKSSRDPEGFVYKLGEKVSEEEFKSLLKGRESSGSNSSTIPKKNPESPEAATLFPFLSKGNAKQ